MRTITLLVGVSAFAALAQSAPVEVFVDRGETYVRLGSDAGLAMGSMITVVGDPIANTETRRRVGTAAVMEVWPQLARINLDEAARADKATKKFVEPPARRPAAPLPSAEPAPIPLPPVAAAPTATPPLRGHAVYRGAGHWMVVQLFNDDVRAWTRCTLELPGGRFYSLERLRAQDRESIAQSNFSHSEHDVPADSVLVRCAEGSSRFIFPF